MDVMRKILLSLSAGPVDLPKLEGVVDRGSIDESVHLGLVKLSIFSVPEGGEKTAELTKKGREALFREAKL